VKAVVMHEAALKAQAKKMNVESLRAGDQTGDSVEFKIAKVAFDNHFENELLRRFTYDRLNL
jgi:hypothetical protein